MRDLLVIVPTRGRPQNLRRLLKAWEETEATADLIACVDTDDPFLDEYVAMDLDFLASGPRQGLVGWTNEAAMEYCDQYRYLGSIGDDHVPRTVGWDRRICDALKELGTGIAYGDDLIQHEALPTACFLTSNIVRAIGYMCPPSLEHQYIDNVWLGWGRALGLRYLPDVVIEHMHPVAGQVQGDALYDESAALMDRDRRAFEEYLANSFTSDIAKVALSSV
jgi:hypothetical protein